MFRISSADVQERRIASLGHEWWGWSERSDGEKGLFQPFSTARTDKKRALQRGSFCINMQKMGMCRVLDLYIYLFLTGGYTFMN